MTEGHLCIRVIDFNVAPATRVPSAAQSQRTAAQTSLAVLSFGESWHNSHHADPTGARHGVLRGQIDPAARLIWLFEKLGWAHDVRWPDAARLAARRTNP